MEYLGMACSQSSVMLVTSDICHILFYKQLFELDYVSPTL